MEAKVRGAAVVVAEAEVGGPVMLAGAVGGNVMEAGVVIGGAAMPFEAAAAVRGREATEDFQTRSVKIRSPEEMLPLVPSYQNRRGGKFAVSLLPMFGGLAKKGSAGQQKPRFPSYRIGDEEAKTEAVERRRGGEAERRGGDGQVGRRGGDGLTERQGQWRGREAERRKGGAKRRRLTGGSERLRGGSERLRGGSERRRRREAERRKGGAKRRRLTSGSERLRGGRRIGEAETVDGRRQEGGDGQAETVERRTG